MIKLIRRSGERQLLNEKRKDYRNVVIIQIIIVSLGLLLADYLKNDPDTSVSRFVTLLMSGFAGFYAILLWDMLRNFTKNEWLVRILLLVIILVILAGLVTEFPYYKLINVPNRRFYLLTIHSIILMIEIIVVAYTLRDVFSGRFLSGDKLWGAACVYLMIGIAFASLYDIINFIFPGCFGVDLELGLPSYAESIYYSMAILGGIDPLYEHPIKIVRNISVIEAVWGNLFAILIIGRLLSLPLKDEKQEDPDLI